MKKEEKIAIERNNGELEAAAGGVRGWWFYDGPSRTVGGIKGRYAIFKENKGGKFVEYPAIEPLFIPDGAKYSQIRPTLEAYSKEYGVVLDPYPWNS